MNKFDIDTFNSLIGKKDIQIDSFTFRPLSNNKGLFFKNSKTEVVTWNITSNGVLVLVFKNKLLKKFIFYNEKCYFIKNKNNKYEKKEVTLKIVNRELRKTLTIIDFKIYFLFFLFYILELFFLKIITNNIYFLDINNYFLFIFSLFLFFYSIPYIKKLIHYIS